MKHSRELMIKLYTDMVRVRKLEEKHLECLSTGKIKLFYHSGIGQEAPGVALGALLKADDYIFYNHRSHGINKCLPKGISAKEILAEHFCKTTRVCGGYAGCHYADKSQMLYAF
jgi:TPP-dependent pyruvate/acetoin dehydrogenase alpha subunit